MAKKNVKLFLCQSCGQNHAKWEGQCKGCGEWNTLVAETAPKGTRGGSFQSGSANLSLCQALSEVDGERAARIHTGLEGFDDLLGGGMVPGGISLIGGEPGVGKSTFMLQLASRLAVRMKPIAYVSGEESASQIKLRSDRLRVGNGDDIFLISEQNLDNALGAILAYQPRLLIVDSIQTVFTSQLDASPGTVSQIRECASILTKFGKDRGLPVMIVGHVTKDGSIAGPKILEHMVDTVLYFEGDVNTDFRLLRVFKNRFGATGEVAVFQMTTTGLHPILNPSDLFVKRERVDAPGVVVVPLLQGTRCILTELQALVTQSFLSMPRRVVAGLDTNRLHLVVAVLEKHCGLKFYNKDVFTNVAGGLRMLESGGDLGLALALVGSALDRPLPRDLLPIGELTLSGEVRPVGQLDRRLAEGRRFGFRRFLGAPPADKKSVDGFIPVATISEALEKALPGCLNS